MSELWWLSGPWEGNIIRTVLCHIFCYKHTHTSSSYKWTGTCCFSFYMRYIACFFSDLSPICSSVFTFFCGGGFCFVNCFILFVGINVVSCVDSLVSKVTYCVFSGALLIQSLTAHFAFSNYESLILLTNGGTRYTQPVLSLCRLACYPGACNWEPAMCVCAVADGATEGGVQGRRWRRTHTSVVKFLHRRVRSCGWQTTQGVHVVLIVNLCSKTENSLLPEIIKKNSPEKENKKEKWGAQKNGKMAQKSVNAVLWIPTRQFLLGTVTLTLSFDFLKRCF